jgi:predicted DNA-binding transcriptional regulator YafY
MNRTDRLLAIILELQRHGVQRAEDLAATFETSKRTIYRDMLALAEGGVPVVSVTGQGYSLVEGYFLPPVSFTADEATMLLLGADVMAQSFDAQYRKAAQGAAAKIDGVLTPKLHEDVRALQVSLRFINSFVAGDDAVLERLQLLRRAILECRRVRFRYFARFAEKSFGEPREVEPHSLTFVERTWFVSGRDLKHDQPRRFRLDRIEDLTLLPQTFVRPAIEQLRRETSSDRGELTLTVRALFDPSITRWVRERRSWFAEREEDMADGLLVTFRVRHEGELLQYLLQWGGKIRVLEPASLRARMLAEAEEMLRLHQSALPASPLWREE